MVTSHHLKKEVLDVNTDISNLWGKLGNDAQPLKNMTWFLLVSRSIIRFLARLARVGVGLLALYAKASRGKGAAHVGPVGSCDGGGGTHRCTPLRSAPQTC